MTIELAEKICYICAILTNLFTYIPFLMKRSFTLLCCCVASLGFICHGASTSYKSLVLEHTDSQFSRVTLQPDMTTAFADGELVMTYKSGAMLYEIRKPLNELRHWTFSTAEGDDNLWAGIGSAEADKVSIEWLGTVIRVSGLRADSRVMLVTVDGRCVRNLTVQNECELRHVGLVKGVYVLTINEKSFKIAVKQ